MTPSPKGNKAAVLLMVLLATIGCINAVKQRALSTREASDAIAADQVNSSPHEESIEVVPQAVKTRKKRIMRREKKPEAEVSLMVSESESDRGLVLDSEGSEDEDVSSADEQKADEETKEQEDVSSAGDDSSEESDASSEGDLASQTCSAFTCPSGYNTKTGGDPKAECTSSAMCLFNCCTEDINHNTTRRNKVLTYATLMAMQNVTTVHNNMNHPVVHNGSNYVSDMTKLGDAVSGLYKVMHQIDSQKAQTYCPLPTSAGDFTYLVSIRSCIDHALCFIEHHITASDAAGNETETYTLLKEYYSRFVDLDWDNLMTDLEDESKKSHNWNGGVSPLNASAADYVDSAELECSGFTGAGVLDLLQTDSNMEGEASVKEQILRIALGASVALRDAAKSTHAVLDSFTQNATEDAIVASLHQAWKRPCALLQCDHTNYWDLLGASHAHSLALIDAGASARHMGVHVRTRARLEFRMMKFLGEHQVTFASRIYRTEGTSTEARLDKYGSVLFGALRHVLTTFPKQHGFDTTMLSFANRKQMKEFADTPYASKVFEQVLNQGLPAIQTNFTMPAGADALLEQALRGAGKDEDASGGGIWPGANNLGAAAEYTGTNGYHGSYEGFVAVGNGIATFVTALGTIITIFVDFILSLFKCFGFGTVVNTGYGTKFPKPPLPCPSPDPVWKGVSFSIGGAVQLDVQKLLGGEAALMAAFDMSVIAGLIPDACVGITRVGLRIGVGIKAGILCDTADCIIKLGVGLVASAAVATSAPICASNPLEVNHHGKFGCIKTLGIVVKLLCCEISLRNGYETCGGGGGNGNIKDQIDAYIANGGNSSCDEGNFYAGPVGGSGDGTEYRGCQSKTKTGRTCQKWSVQIPHQTNEAVYGVYSQGFMCGATCLETEAQRQVACNPRRSWNNMNSWYANRDAGVGDCSWGCENSGHSSWCKHYEFSTQDGGTCKMYDCEPDTVNVCKEWSGPNGIGDHNFCRNPCPEADFHDPWCYTTDAGSKWEYCYPNALCQVVVEGYSDWKVTFDGVGDYAQAQYEARGAKTDAPSGNSGSAKSVTVRGKGCKVKLFSGGNFGGQSTPTFEGCVEETLRPGCYYRQATAGNGRCGDSGVGVWTEDKWGKRHRNTHTSQSACMGRKGGHERHCGVVGKTSWKFVAQDASKCPGGHHVLNSHWFEKRSMKIWYEHPNCEQDVKYGLPSQAECSQACLSENWCVDSKYRASIAGTTGSCHLYNCQTSGNADTHNDAVFDDNGFTEPESEEVQTINTAVAQNMGSPHQIGNGPGAIVIPMGYR